MKTSPHVGRTARYLAQYWKNAYTIRARGLTMQPVTSNKVLELVAFSKWQEQDWSFNFRANHALALNQIISRNSDEIRAIVKEARDSSEDRDIRHLLEKAEELQREVNAANDLLEVLSG